MLGTLYSYVESIVQDGKRVNYHYDTAGMRTATQLFSQGSEVVTTSQTYDGMGRLTQIRHGDIAQYDFSWDIANRITSMNDAEYGYDQTSQLVSAEYETLPKELYEYDANGNRKAFETGKNNQLLSDGVFDYKYDDEGNRVLKVSKDSRTEYAWDYRNRLVRVVDNGKSVEYAYDYQNRLVRRNDELFLHDGWQIACSLRNGKVEHRYLWGAAQDELLAVDDMWTLRDHLNTVRKVVDAKGGVVSELEYNAFGVLVNATGDKPLFRYTGKMFDDATGLQWNVNRWYDARVGRWVSEDPIGFEGKDYNGYRYVLGNPVRHTDVLGLHISEEDKKLECDRALAASGVLGLVLCFRGVVVVCVDDTAIDDKVGKHSGMAAEIVKICTKVHEDLHVLQLDEAGIICDPCAFGPMTVPAIVADVFECAAYRAEYNCLQQRKLLCGLLPDPEAAKACMGTIEAYAEGTKEEGAEICERVGLKF